MQKMPLGFWDSCQFNWLSMSGVIAVGYPCLSLSVVMSELVRYCVGVFKGVLIFSASHTAPTSWDCPLSKFGLKVCSPACKNGSSLHGRLNDPTLCGQKSTIHNNKHIWPGLSVEGTQLCDTDWQRWTWRGMLWTRPTWCCINFHLLAYHEIYFSFL